MKSGVKNTILGILLAITLTAVTNAEFIIGFKVLYNKQIDDVSSLIDIASRHGQASVSIDEISVYSEVPEIDKDGDVIGLKDYNIKVKIHGVVTDDSMSSYGKYSYCNAEDASSCVFAYEHKAVGYKDFLSALNSYWHGEPEEILDVCSIAHAGSDVEYYQNSAASGSVPVVYIDSVNLYYMFVDCADDSYMILSAPDPYVLSDEKITVHFGDPSTSPMLSHTYSDYETLAAENTIRSLLDGADEDTDVDNPYTSNGISGASVNYTSEAANAVRNQLVSLSNYTFDKDGKSTETSYKVDISSDTAKESEWVLTETEYDYTNNDLRISTLSGKRTENEFSISGNINNMLDTERPYVVIVKYLDSNGGLLGLSVIDKRATPLAPSDASTFSVIITPVRNNIDIRKITSVMFEAY